MGLVRRKNLLSLFFRVDCPPGSLALPEPQEAGRTDGLWQHTCFEAFVGRGDNGYAEFNLSPSGQWAAYDFDSYRGGMRNREVLAPKITVESGPFEVVLTADLDVAVATDRGAKIALWLVVGLVLLPIGARLLVDGATDIARGFGISEAVIGLTLVAIGTSLPELAASVASALRGRADMALGNVIGSNLFNILAIMGITAFFGPLEVPEQMLRFDLWFMLATTALLGPFLLRHIAVGRVAGLALLSIYGAYVLWLLA